MPVSIWSTWALIKSVLEPLQSPEFQEESEVECETPPKGGPEYTESSGGRVKKMQEALKAAVPSLRFCLGKTDFPLPPLPPSS